MIFYFEKSKSSDTSGPRKSACVFKIKAMFILKCIVYSETNNALVDLGDDPGTLPSTEELFS